MLARYAECVPNNVHRIEVNLLITFEEMGIGQIKYKQWIRVDGLDKILIQ